jgi:hypothetical protein
MKPFSLSYILSKFVLNKPKDVQDREVFNFFWSFFGEGLPKFLTFSKLYKISSF